MSRIIEKIAEELNVKIPQIEATVQLLDNGDTVPFIARYRKEVTGGLTDTQLRTLEERLQYLRELSDRKAVILKSIEEQGKLTEALKKSIDEVDSKARLEDLYLPFKPKRRTKGQIAKEAGLEPLSMALMQDPSLCPQKTAEAYINLEKNITDTKAALEGARFILMEQFAEEAPLIGECREKLWNEAVLTSRVVEGKEESGEKFKDYFNYAEPLKQIPSHRLLAMLRGRQEGFLQIQMECNTQAFEERVIAYFKLQDLKHGAYPWLIETARWTWRIKLFLQLELDLMNRLREKSETDAIQVFACNVRDLLMMAPAGSKVTMGLDPGQRTGVKVAIVDGTGKVLHHTTLYPHAPHNQWDQSIKKLADICQQFKVELISIGNGTASRETDALVSELATHYSDLKFKKIVVSEAGASVYSASELASEEFPDLDVTIRGAVSIARRLQDPLAELVKIDPKAIGVGQYQHDVSQVKLSRSLDSVVVDCVNAVGVDVNTASIPLLARVSGLNNTIAKNIVSFRDEHGLFTDRKALAKIPRLGAKTFEQAAGFLRILSGENPLDASAVHPEAYPIIEKIIKKTNKTIHELIGNKAFIDTLKPIDYIDDQFGLPTITDIFKELEKPGRDPRPEFKTASFDQKVHTLANVKVGMILEGVVSNVANFGAFVDIGVHQDGLVHISALSDSFVKNPRDIVKAGDIVKVKVLEVDVKRKRISLTLRLDEKPQNFPEKNLDKSNNVKQDSRPHTSKPNPTVKSKTKSSSNKPMNSNSMGLFGETLKAALKQNEK